MEGSVRGEDLPCGEKRRLKSRDDNSGKSVSAAGQNEGNKEEERIPIGEANVVASKRPSAIKRLKAQLISQRNNTPHYRIIHPRRQRSSNNLSFISPGHPDIKCICSPAETGVYLHTYTLIWLETVTVTAAEADHETSAPVH